MYCWAIEYEIMIRSTRKTKLATHFVHVSYTVDEYFRKVIKILSTYGIICDIRENL